MRNTLTLAIFALFFASCHNDVPKLLAPDEVEFLWCGYVSPDGFQCKSTYEVSKEDCKLVGKLFEDEDCETPCKNCEE